MKFLFVAILSLAGFILPATDFARAQTPPALHVQGNQLVDANGKFVRLRGVNRDGSEYACVQNFGFFDGPVDAPSIAAMKAWHTNVVRVPLNEDCWGQGAPGQVTGIITKNQYTGQAYRDAIVGFVQALNNAGLYVILDLHWNVAGNQAATAQQTMADESYSPAFWTSVATTFKSFPAVIFDLYNEPHDISWDCWQNGCTPNGQSWATAGMTQLIMAVRSAGATQPIMLGGLGYASDLSQWLASVPADPIQGAPQLIASVHSYCGPPGTSTVAACQTNLNQMQQAQWPVIKTVAASVPVVTGEFGEYDCATTYVAPYMGFADANGVSYVGFGWNTTDCGAFPALVSDYGGTPTAYGIGLKAHLAAFIRHDFDGNGMSDIAWRDTSGTTAAWLMNGSQVASSGSFGVIAGWQIVGQRDFNGDGNHDWLWRDGSGNLAIWLLKGLSVLQSGGFGTVPITWTVQGTSDFNGDGKGDILWQDAAGNVAIWLMNGLSVAQSGGIGNVPTTWKIKGTDGQGHILWQDMTSGTVAIWTMNGLSVAQSVSLGAVSSNWKIAGTGDFNNDGIIDILWQDSTTGTVAIWLLNASLQVAQSGSLGVVPSPWSIALTGDYNGDGNSDILWRNTTTGDVAIWFLNGLQVSSTSAIGNVPNTWTIQSANAE